MNNKHHDTDRATRHITTLGQVQQSFLEAAINIWHADKVNQPLSSSDTVLILLDQKRADANQYIEILKHIDRQECSVGVIPISDSSNSTHLERLLGQNVLQIDFTNSRFRLPVNAEANLPGAPPVLQRARSDDQLSVGADLKVADMLFLQGHAGPIDAVFGKSLNLCSRHLYQPGTPPLFPCFGTNQCFRQDLHGRVATSEDGLINPSTLQSPLVILDGCSTFPLPGTLYKYETSILRSLMDSQMRAGVLTTGATSTPVSAIIIFLAMLASGRTLGQAVREANYHQHESHNSSSIEGVAAAPWIIVGNPEMRVLGLPLIERTPRRDRGTIEFTLDVEDIPAQTGTLVSLANITATDGPFDVMGSEGRWARGALQREGCAYLWIGPQATDRAEQVTQKQVEIALLKRSEDQIAWWRERSLWLQANRRWLERMIALVSNRGGNAEGVRSLIPLWDDVASTVEQVASTTGPHQRHAIGPPLAAWTNQLLSIIAQLDRMTALNVGAVLPFAGARLSHLWAPAWLERGFVPIAESCSCGCSIVGNVCRHPILDLSRIELSCPACGLLGDVSAWDMVSTPGSREVTPTVLAILQDRLATRGQTITWSVQRPSDEQAKGFACAALFDPFRRRQVITDAFNIPPGERGFIPMSIPHDWPLGLSWAAIIMTIGGTMSVMGYDIVVNGS